MLTRLDRFRLIYDPGELTVAIKLVKTLFNGQAELKTIEIKYNTPCSLSHEYVGIDVWLIRIIFTSYFKSI